jgi:hypothetical protein
MRNPVTIGPEVEVYTIPIAAYGEPGRVLTIIRSSGPKMSPHARWGLATIINARSRIRTMCRRMTASHLH